MNIRYQNAAIFGDQYGGVGSSPIDIYDFYDIFGAFQLSDSFRSDLNISNLILLLDIEILYGKYSSLEIITCFKSYKSTPPSTYKIKSFKLPLPGENLIFDMQVRFVFTTRDACSFKSQIFN